MGVGYSRFMPSTLPIALIPARGGSKRIPGKNIRPFAGVPLLGRSISVALSAKVFSRVIVSTDDPKVEEVAVEYGAEVPFRRPAEIANDSAPTDAVLQHALDWLSDRNELPSQLCCVFATAPLLEAEALRRGLELLVEHDAATALAVTTFHFPIQRALRSTPAGRLVMREPEHRLTRSQDLEEHMHDAGQFFWIDVAKYRACGAIYNDNMVPVALPPHRVQDIDTEADWTRAELMWEALNRQSGGRD